MTIADYELIDKKVEGKLTFEEDLHFAERMRQDSEFAEAYRTQHLAIDALQTHHTQALRTEVKQMYTRVKARRQQKVRWYYAAAAVILLSMVSLAAYWYLLSPASEQLYATYYTVYPAQRITRGEDTTSYSVGLRLYSEGQYAEAIPYLEPLAATDSLRDRMHLLLGNAYLQTGQLAEAQRVLSKVAASDDALLRQQGQWYLALSYLKQEDTSQARAILEELSLEGMYQKEASEVLTYL